MEMTMLLLVSAVTLLVSPAVASPPRHHKRNINLDHVIDLTQKYNESLTKVYFVEDVKHLVDAGCKDKFFCKVHQILHEHDVFGNSTNEEELVRNLAMFLSTKNINCAELLKDDVNTGITRPIPDLLSYLKTCIQRRNFTATNKVQSVNTS